MTFLIMTTGFLIAAWTFGALVWSTAYPAKRLWPPISYSVCTPIIAWGATVAIFGAVLVLGVIGCGQMPIPNWVRFGLGLPIIVVSNIVVWNEVRSFGIAQTSGAFGTLKTDGLYRYSRNPQYVADACMIFGWLLLSSSAAAVPLGAVGILLLLFAPFAEEPWLRERFGREFDNYRAKTRRYF